MASVAAHLAKMLSTRAGSVQTLSDYGLPDLNDMRLSLHDSLSQARQAIENFIEAYEPRLSAVRVISRRVNTISSAGLQHRRLAGSGWNQAPGQFYRVPGWQRSSQGQLRRTRMS
jgi:type VI secretion system lysozyme-like protein